MKDAADTKTADMHGEPKKRGRPATGAAKTAAERKRAQRRRDRHNISNAFHDSKNWSTMPTGTLCEALSSYVTSGFAILAGPIMKELARRANINDEARTLASDRDYDKNYQTLVTVTVTHERRTEHTIPETVTETKEEPEIHVTVTKSKAAPKYRSPTGETWSGRGQRPRWVQNHINNGGTLAELLL